MANNQALSENRICVTAEEKLLLDQLMGSAGITRTDLSERLDVSPAWITKTITPLIHRNIIEETGKAARSGGRRARTLGISHQSGYLLGIEFGATSLKTAVADPNISSIIEKQITINIHKGPEKCLDELYQLSDSLLSEIDLHKEQIRGIGVGVPGFVDYSSGNMRVSPVMPGWEDYSILEALAVHFQHSFALMDNVVNLMALGEIHQSEVSLAPNFIFLKIGSDIGAAIVCDGELYRGSSGCAGDVGHIIVSPNGPLCHCGNYGCVEALAGGKAIADKALILAKSGESPLLADILKGTQKRITSVDVGTAAAQGDLAALELIDRSGQYVGEMLAHLVRFYNPDLILLAGGVSHIGHRYLNAIRQVVLEKASPLATRDLRIEYSPLGDQAGLFGALSLAQHHMFFVPEQ